MTGARRAAPAALVAVLLAAAAMLVAAAGTTRAAEPIAVDVDLGVLSPAVPVTQSTVVDVPEDATVTRSEWVELTGIADQITWDIQMCTGGSCIDVAPPRTGQSVPAGTYDFIVTGTLDAAATGSGHALGVVELASDDVLSATGGTVPWGAIALAVAAVAVGGVAVAVAVRGRQKR